MKTSIHFPRIPQIDTRFAIDGQDYVMIGHEPYERSDGCAGTFLVWQTHCADCGAAFQVKTPLGFTTGQSRRCEAHRKPGVRVKKRVRRTT